VTTAATKLDLVENEEIIHNGAIFQQTPEDQPTGTGVFDSFVRLDENSAAEEPRDGRSQGYNTSGRPVPFDELQDPNFTRDVRLGDLVPVEVDEGLYYSFRLDINEPGNGDATLSLDTIKLFVSGSGSQTTTDVESLGAKVFDLDALGDVFLKLDARLRAGGGAPGSGTGDMTMYVPVGLFDGFDAGDFVYLYSEFGLQSGMRTDALGEQAGFEEWATLIPEPAAGVLVGLALLAISSRLRARA
jgi:hypothetical protein